jgi:hypothetical protein
MRLKMVKRIALLIACSFAAAPAWAQGVPCGRPEQIDRELRMRYGEHPAFQAISASGNLVSIYVNPSSGTWTVLTFPRPDVACMAAMGEAWTALPAEPGGEPS